LKNRVKNIIKVHFVADDNDDYDFEKNYINEENQNYNDTNINNNVMSKKIDKETTEEFDNNEIEFNDENEVEPEIVFKFINIS